MGDPMNPFNAWRILREALKLLSKHQSLMLPLVLMSLLFSSLLFLCNYLSLTPLLMDLSLNLYTMQSINSDSLLRSKLLATVEIDIRKISVVAFIFVVAPFIICAFLSIAMIYACATACIGRQVALKELLARIGKSWKGPIITQLYASSLDIGCKLLIMALAAFFMFICNGSMFLIALGAIPTLLALYFYIRLTLAWSISSVLSVVEDGCYGLEAIGRAKVLIKQRRRQGTVVTTVMVMTTGAILMAYAFATQIASSNQLAAGLVMANASMLLNIYSVMAHVVLYYECKKSCGEEEMLIKGKFVYDDLPAPNVETELQNFHQ